MVIYCYLTSLLHWTTRECVITLRSKSIRRSITTSVNRIRITISDLTNIQAQVRPRLIWMCFSKERYRMCFPTNNMVGSLLDRVSVKYNHNSLDSGAILDLTFCIDDSLSLKTVCTPLNIMWCLCYAPLLLKIVCLPLNVVSFFVVCSSFVENRMYSSRWHINSLLCFFIVKKRMLSSKCHIVFSTMVLYLWRPYVLLEMS